MDRTTARQVTTNKTFLIQEEPRGPSMLIEIPVLANGSSEIAFPDVPELRNDTSQKVVIKAMRVIIDSVLTRGPVTGNVTSPLTELQKISLVLYCESWIKGKNIPILTLNDNFVEASGACWHNRTMQFANWENVDWSKSILKFSNGTTSAQQPYTVLLEVEYLKLNPQGFEIIGPG
jgi:hypothetical protein